MCEADVNLNWLPHNFLFFILLILTWSSICGSHKIEIVDYTGERFFTLTELYGLETTWLDTERSFFFVCFPQNINRLRWKFCSSAKKEYVKASVNCEIWFKLTHKYTNKAHYSHSSHRIVKSFTIPFQPKIYDSMTLLLSLVKWE